LPANNSILAATMMDFRLLGAVYLEKRNASIMCSLS
jgi:hypothetical protein